MSLCRCRPRMPLLLLVVVITTATGFTAPWGLLSRRRPTTTTNLLAVVQPPQPTESSITDNADNDHDADNDADNNDNEALPQDKWKQRAQELRLEAQQMELELSLQKIAVLEQKIANENNKNAQPPQPTAPNNNNNNNNNDNSLQVWQQQLNALKQRVQDASTAPTTTTTTTTPTTTSTTSATTSTTDSVVQTDTTTTTTPTTTPLPVMVEQDDDDDDDETRYRQLCQTDSPLCGFDEDDLRVYEPVCRAMEQNNTYDSDTALLQAFRENPDLQEYFRQKIANLVSKPLEALQKIEQLQQDFWRSNSRVEKDQIKRELEQQLQLQQQQANDMTVVMTDKVDLQLPPLTPARHAERMEAVRKLPRTLQLLFISRTSGLKALPTAQKDNTTTTTNNADLVAVLELSVYMDYYDGQLQILEQVAGFESAEKRQQVQSAVQGLPRPLQEYIAQRGNLTAWTVDDLVQVLCAPDNDDDKTSLSQWGAALGGVPVEISSGAPQRRRQNNYAPYANDLDFMERLRYMDELYPPLKDMPVLPSNATVIQEQVVGAPGLFQGLFMVQSLPEPCPGGYFLRGECLLENATDLVPRLRERLAAMPHDDSTVYNNWQFFYLPDPVPLSDEYFEMGYEVEFVLYVTTRETMTNMFPTPLVLTEQFSLMGLGVASTAVWSWLLLSGNSQAADFVVPTDWWTAMGAIGLVHLSHELGHRLVAWRDGFALGTPYPIASVQLGLFAATSPLKSPPPSLQSLFDFGMAGPTLGILTSLALFVYGLTLNPDTFVTLPDTLTSLVQNSALCGGLVDYRLGGGTTTLTTTMALHPLTAVGAAGLWTNAIALLPMGRTDGGRVAVAMFGRRGAFLIQTFTSLLLAASGLLGLDDSYILLSYVLFVFIFQRELEAPCQNEVDELDLGRGLFGILMGLVVFSIVVPLR